MNNIRRKCREADSNIFSSTFKRSAIPDPFVFGSHNSLPFTDNKFFILCIDLQFAFQNHRVFIEFWSLSRLLPAFMARHMRNAYLRCFAVDMTKKFPDDFFFITGSLDY